MVNSELYQTLVRQFGWVQVLRENESAEYHHIVSPIRSLSDRSASIRLDYSGEEFRVNCPFCNDTNGHLYINHLYGVDPELTVDRMPSLAYCHHGCLNAAKNRMALRSMLLGLGTRNVFHIKQDNSVLFKKPVPRKLEPLSNVIPIEALPAWHVARKYLCEERGYSLDTLTKYSVGYCDSSSQTKYIKNCIVLPVYFKQAFSGWQARYIGDPPPNVPKYYIQPGMRKSNVLYGYDFAFDKPYIVIVEGVTDVWRVGNQAVCGFGKHLSLFQRDSLCSLGKPLVVMLDPDAREEAMKLTAVLKRNTTAPVYQVQLPSKDSGKSDPGSFSHEFLIELIEQEMNNGKEG